MAPTAIGQVAWSHAHIERDVAPDQGGQHHQPDRHQATGDTGAFSASTRCRVTG